ncbi:MAG: dihydrofolate reductase [Treponema sp.]|jgi:dihydrofolate reductase|nr:dihydrofolate reductase [Treponema sp.]
MREIIIIAAMAENRVIGKNNVMPWSIKEEMAHFTKLTKGWPCIMGRKTWESLKKKPLPGRLNVVISEKLTEVRQICPQEADLSSIKIFPSLPAAIEHCARYEKIFICGGESIYKQALSLANKIELTVIHNQYDGDTFFPEIDVTQWTITNTEDFDAFSFITYTRIK